MPGDGISPSRGQVSLGKVKCIEKRHRGKRTNREKFRKLVVVTKLEA